MRHLVYAGLPAPGHVLPSLPVVAELVRRGERVVYCDSEEFRAPIEGTGAVFRPYPVAMPTAEEIGRRLEAGNLTRVALELLRKTPDLLAFLKREIAAEPPAAVLFDSNALWGEMAARAAGLPSVGFVISLVPDAAGPLTLRERALLLVHGLRALPGFVAAQRRLRREHGPDVFPPRGIFPATGDLNVLFSSASMQPPTPRVDGSFRLVGTSIDPARAAETLDLEVEPPLVYVAVGTLMGGAAFLRLATRALADHPGSVLLAAGHAASEDIGSLPPHIRLRRHVPQLAVLARSAVFVTHGGMNSVHEALFYGVPMVVVAHNAEWAFIGRRVQANGAGLLLGGSPPYGRVTEAELRAAVGRVLGEASFRGAAQRLGEEMRAGGGFRRAADEVQHLLAAGRK